jgi:hypothetical protein
VRPRAAERQQFGGERLHVVEFDHDRAVLVVAGTLVTEDEKSIAVIVVQAEVQARCALTNRVTLSA